MHRQLKYFFFLVLLATLAVAQQANTSAHAAAKPAAGASLPSEETINAFMHQWFGYDPSLTWKISSVKPSEAEGLTEVDIVISSPKGQQASKLYVTADGKHAVIGDIMPFGA